MAKAWLSLGANMGSPARQVARALQLIGQNQNIRITKKSSLIITSPWGKTDQPDFHNMAIEISTGLSPLQLLDACQHMENIMGRVRGEKWGPRLIDIDIIAFDRIRMHEPRLNLPHHHAHERDFVLVPLREISPDTADWILQIKKPD